MPERCALLALRCFRRRGRIPLAAPHPRDLDALKEPRRAKRLLGGETLGIFPARHVDDQDAARAGDSVVRQHGAAKDQDILVRIEIGGVGVALLSTDRRAAGLVDLVDDVEHRRRLLLATLGAPVDLQLVALGERRGCCGRRAGRVIMRLSGSDHTEFREVHMRLTITRWLGREFVFLTGEAPRCATVRDELQGIVREMEHELNRHGLALGDTVRTRLWATDRASRNEASRERRRIFDGAARSVSSSFIAPDVFSSGARVALDVVALRASPAVGPKDLHEYDPPIVPLRFLRLDSLVFLSGVTSVRAK